MFIGQIGFTYRLGLASMWMLIGWTIGDYLAWRFLYRRVREISGESNEISPLALLKPSDGNGIRILVPLAGLVTVFYLSMYAAAQLKAGGTALQIDIWAAGESGGHHRRIDRRHLLFFWGYPGVDLDGRGPIRCHVRLHASSRFDCQFRRRRTGGTI